MKAIRITSSNQPKIAAQYGSEDVLEEFPVGCWLVAGFGTRVEDHYEGVFSDEAFTAQFNVLDTMKNGYVEVTLK